MSTDEPNPYDLLQLTVDVTDSDIRKAYRQRSLKVHPDRNPDNPDAARLFHELTQASELLLDPLRRMALDAKLRLAAAKKARFAAYDNKRKNLVAELEERERAFKKSRVEKDKEERERYQESERIKEEGRRLREVREKERQRREDELAKEVVSEEEVGSTEDEPPELGALDTTVRLKYPLSSHPGLTTQEALSTLLSPFGPVDTPSIVISIKPPKKAPHKPPKHGVALVPFKQVGAAFAAVCASGRKERGLEGVDITWAEGQEPQLIQWLKKMGKLGSAAAGGATDKGNSTTQGYEAKSSDSRNASPRPSFRFTDSTTGAKSSSPFSSFPDSFPDTSAPPPVPSTTSAPSGVDYESLTLMRMRQAERDRLEREILEQEAGA